MSDIGAARKYLTDALPLADLIQKALDALAVGDAPVTPVIDRPFGGIQDEGAFFAAVRGELWPRLNQMQVDGCQAIIAACAGKMPASWAAYALATAYHETAYTMQPVRERGSGDGKDSDAWDDYLEKYDTGKLASDLGNTPAADGDGVLYAGRGYVQLTGRANYARAEKELGQPFLTQPDLALRPDLAAAIMVRGMSEGWFTGKSLNTYIPTTPTLAQFTNARRIINGTDRAAQIGGYAVKFYAALQAGGWQ